MQNELQFLIKLQSMDSSIEENKNHADEKASEIQNLNQKIEALKAGTKAIKDKITTFQLKKKQLELDAENQEKLVKKHQGELNSLKSNDAYKTMLGEIEAAKKAQAKIEDEILVVMESLDVSDKELKAQDAKLKQDEGVIKAEIQKLESEKKSFLEKMKAVETERATFAPTVPQALFSQYESIRKKRGTLIIVPLLRNACGGCRMNLTPSKVNEVKLGKSMVLCDSCTRIVYQAPEEAAAEAAASTPTPATPV